MVSVLGLRRAVTSDSTVFAQDSISQKTLAAVCHDHFQHICFTSRVMKGELPSWADRDTPSSMRSSGRHCRSRGVSAPWELAGARGPRQAGRGSAAQRTLFKCSIGEGLKFTQGHRGCDNYNHRFLAPQ